MKDLIQKDHKSSSALLINNLSKPKKIFTEGCYLKANILAFAQASEYTAIVKNHSLYQNNSTTTLLTTKLWLRLCYSSAPPIKTSWHKEPINVKKSLLLCH